MKNAAQESEDLRYISDPMRWAGLICPLKRWNKDKTSREVGYMIGDGPIIYLGNMFNAKPDDPKKVYENYRDIILDGWEVD